MAKKRKLPEPILLVWLLRIISLIGIAVMLYLSQLHFTQTGSAVCELGEGLSCEAVNASKYSEVLGIPIAFLGVGYFALVLLLSFTRVSAATWQLIFFLTLFVLMPSFYFTLTEIFIIKSICIFCELSKILMLFILATSTFALKQAKKLPPTRNIFTMVVLSIVAAGITWYIQTRPSSDIPYDNLAQCLTEQNVIMYGSITCAVCARVKDTFGESFQYVQEVECNPRGPNPEVERCLAKKIDKTPTWIVEVDGEEVKRNTGFTGVTELARFAGCETALEQDRTETQK